MEDISRIVDKELLKGLALKSRKRSQRWDMFLVADDGKMFVIKKFKWFLRICTILFIVMILSLSVCVFLLVKSELSRSDYKNELTLAKVTIGELRQAKEHLEAQSVIMLDNKGSEKTTNLLSSKDTNDINQPKVLLEKTLSAGKVFISKRSDNNKYKVRFRLANLTSQDKPVNGYVFIILKKVDGNIDRTIPNVNLINEKPAEYRKGQYFSISRFKTVRFNFDRATEPESYKECIILAYSLTGRLLLDKRFSIKVELISPPVAVEKPINTKMDNKIVKEESKNSVKAKSEIKKNQENKENDTEEKKEETQKPILEAE
jgi:hypothetical protein